MSFQIRFEDSPIEMGELDRQAAELWGKEIGEKHYTTPTPAFNNINNLTGIELTKARLEYSRYEAPSWFEVIGYQIHKPQTNWTTGWDNIKACIWSLHITSKYKYVDNRSDLIEHMDFVVEYIKPYFDLIDLWASKGYTPHQIKD